MVQGNSNGLIVKILVPVLTFLLGLVAAGVFTHIAVAEKLGNHAIIIEQHEKRITAHDEMMVTINRLIDKLDKETP